VGSKAAGTAIFTGVQLPEESDLSDRQSLADRIEFLPKRDSPKCWEAEDLAEELGAKLETINRTLRRYKDQRWVKHDDGWATT